MMAPTSSSPCAYDVFFSYNRRDKPEIQTYDRNLTRESLRVFVDYRHLTPGRPWIAELEQAIGASSAIAVFYGPDGFGPTQTREIDLGLALHGPIAIVT
jgi:hypothetical protein